MPDRLRRALPTLIACVLFIAALEVLRTELQSVGWHALTAATLGIPARRLGLALLCTAANYALLTGYDFLAIAYIGKRLPWRHVVVASFLAYAISNNLGFAMLSGASVRYRFYTRWGITADELSRIVFSYVVTFWLGLMLVGGIALVVSPPPRELGLAAPWLVRLIGSALVASSLAYVAAAIARLGPIRLRRLEWPLPPPHLAVAQLVISILEWLVAGAVLYVLLPPGRPSVATFLAAFLAAQLLGLVSHVPGGLGVFDGAMLLLLRPFMSPVAVLPALIAYRAVYYLLPLSIALLILVADEVRLRRAQAARIGAMFGWLTEQLTPRVLASFTFLTGVVLLFSGATPAAEGRLRLLHRVLPLGVIEASHFIASVVGVVLLLLSQGLARRLDAAYFLTVVAIGIGIVASVLKGGDIEEAAILAAVLVVLWRARRAFDRRAALFDTRFSPGWSVAVAGAVGSSIWLGNFAFKHVEYSSQLWWRFELRGEVSRTMRASVGAAVTMLLFAVARLVRQKPHEIVEPTEEDLQAIAPAIATQTSTFPYLVYLRDKGVLFDDDRRGFVMYGVQARTWVALGDPVGPVERIGPLIRLFLERADDFGGVPVFYEISRAHLHRYADVGLTFVKLGEEARVELCGVSLAGGQSKKHRQVLRRVEHGGGTLRIVPPEDVPSIMDQLRAVSDAWLRRQAGAEKGFSVGSFQPAYLERFPVATVEREGRIVAFANLWPGPQKEELSVDLMRFDERAPRDVMEALLVHLMMWGKQQGYQWFSLGMAPLSGFETSPVAPLWNRLASFLYAHGEAVYNFQGLRAYKEKFNPVWEPRYLAYPGGLRLPRILADVSALVAGGYRRIFLK